MIQGRKKKYLIVLPHFQRLHLDDSKAWAFRVVASGRISFSFAGRFFVHARRCSLHFGEGGKKKKILRNFRRTITVHDASRYDSMSSRLRMHCHMANDTNDKGCSITLDDAAITIVTFLTTALGRFRGDADIPLSFRFRMDSASRKTCIDSGVRAPPFFALFFFLLLRETSDFHRNYSHLQFR